MNGCIKNFEPGSLYEDVYGNSFVFIDHIKTKRHIPVFDKESRRLTMKFNTSHYKAKLFCYLDKEYDKESFFVKDNFCLIKDHSFNITNGMVKIPPINIVDYIRKQSIDEIRSFISDFGSNRMDFTSLYEEIFRKSSFFNMYNSSYSGKYEFDVIKLLLFL